VISKLAYAFTQDGDLDFWRSSVSFMTGEFLNGFCFYFLFDRHDVCLSLLSLIYLQVSIPAAINQPQAGLVSGGIITEEKARSKVLCKHFGL
jgi:hypothetical protein